MNFLRYDSDFMMAISRIADYVILNVLCVVFSLPLVTAGAAITAKYYVAMKLARKEEPGVWSAFWKSFRENFRQATILWLIALLLIAFLGVDWFLFWKMQLTSTASAFRIALFVLSVLVAMSICCVFPILARFHVTIPEAMRNAVLFSVLHMPQMLLVILLEFLPYYIGYHYMSWFIGIWVFCTGISLYYAGGMYAKAFAKAEQKAGIQAESEAESETGKEP